MTEQSHLISRSCSFYCCLVLLIPVLVLHTALPICFHFLSLFLLHPKVLSGVSTLSAPLLFTFSCFYCNFTLSPCCFAAPAFFCAPSRLLPLTCACAFCICTTTSAQYFSFTPVSFIFLPPYPFLPPPLCLLLSGSISAPKKSFSLHWALSYHISAPIFALKDK